MPNVPVDCKAMYEALLRKIKRWRVTGSAADKAAAANGYRAYKAVCMGAGKMARTINYPTMEELGVNVGFEGGRKRRTHRRKTHRRKTHKRR